MVPDDQADITAAIRVKLADVERRLSRDAAAMTDDRWRDGAIRLAALRRAADELLGELNRADASATRSDDR